MPELLRLSNITKYYGRQPACLGIDFSVEEGEIHALVGENGAGKTTLMRILYGLVAPDRGEIFWRGRRVVWSSPRQAIGHGLGMVHQHFMLIPALSVLENIVLGAEPGGWRLDLASARRQVEHLMRDLGLELPLDVPLAWVGVAQRQQVELLKALFRRARLLILDEPTAVLGPSERERLFSVLRRLQGQGCSIIFVTHRLAEVFALAQRVTVLRRGRRVAALAVAGTDEARLAKLMMGEELDTVKAARQQGGSSRQQAAGKAGSPEPVIRLEGVYTKAEAGCERLEGVDLEVSAGEIVGVAGVAGNGQRALFEVVLGLRTPEAGRVVFCGEDVFPGGRRAEVACIPEDRLREGVVMGFSVADNLVLGRQRESRFCRAGFFRRQAKVEFAGWALSAFGILPPKPQLPIQALSGGNQQRVVLARELSRNFRLLLAYHPTRGLDVRGARFVLDELQKVRDRGAGVLWVSFELEELLAICDRLAVLCGGRIVWCGRPQGIDSGRLGLLMSGVS